MAAEEEEDPDSRDAKNSSKGRELDRAGGCFSGTLVIGALEGVPADVEEAGALVAGARDDRGDRLLLRPQSSQDFGHWPVAPRNGWRSRSI